jgi:hypothetical protein
MLNFLQSGDKVRTATGETAIILDPRDGHILWAYIAGQGAGHLHETKILGYAGSTFDRKGRQISVTIPFNTED